MTGPAPPQPVLSALAAAAIAAVVAVSATTWARDDDRRVDHATPEARQAAAIARDVVPGRVVEVARDVDNGKWEITIAQAGREYEVELSAGALELLRLDYD